MGLCRRGLAGTCASAELVPRRDGGGHACDGTRAGVAVVSAAALEDRVLLRGYGVAGRSDRDRELCFSQLPCACARSPACWMTGFCGGVFRGDGKRTLDRGALARGA